MNLVDIQILHPKSPNAVPIEPHVTLRVHGLKVIECSPGSITLEIPETTEGIRFRNEVKAVESFLKLGASTLWHSWFDSAFDKSFVSVVRNSAQMKLSFATDKNWCMNKHFGNISMSLMVTGVWCSDQRYGMRCVVKMVNS